MRALLLALLMAFVGVLYAAEPVVLKCHFDVAPEKADYFLTLMRSYNVRQQTVLAYAKSFVLPGPEVYDWTSKLAAPEVLTYDAETGIVTFTITAEDEREAQKIAQTYLSICSYAMDEYATHMRKMSVATIEASIAQEDRKLARALATKDSPAVIAERKRCIETLRELNRQLDQIEASIKAHTATLRPISE